MTTTPRTQRLLGKLVTITATGEWARARLAFTSGEHAGMIELGMTDGTTRLVTAADVLPIADPPQEARAIPVYPDAADGTSRPMGTCENDHCGITANVITIVTGKATRNRHGKTVPAPTKTICTDCYAKIGR
ncbi:hypothetical protein E6R60_26635 [Streptomyces sp. A0642]|uniref:hypothetical protein n=1 Tax=Streptomyces sp. A0642 TaxID=2563100 RepID=UPI0010A26B15|nr:hypothetical protein [Streptomyces sp. A0642]THA72510.1 hypothetical protein E6R60_26635 [Streptomyces sp. A0642]